MGPLAKRVSTREKMIRACVVTGSNKGMEVAAESCGRRSCIRSNVFSKGLFPSHFELTGFKIANGQTVCSMLAYIILSEIPPEKNAIIVNIYRAALDGLVAQNISLEKGLV